MRYIQFKTEQELLKYLEKHRCEFSSHSLTYDYNSNVYTLFYQLKKETDSDAKDDPDAKADPVNHPSHYTQGKIECIDAMIDIFGVEAVKNYCLCNSFKYIWRHKMKNGDEDLAKAAWYMNKLQELHGKEKADANN